MKSSNSSLTASSNELWLFVEKSYQLNRSKKKLEKTNLDGDAHLLHWRGGDIMAEEVPKTRYGDNSQQTPPIVGRSCRDMVNQNNPHPNFNPRMNTVWEANGDNGDLGVFDDDMPDEDDPTCLTICLTAKQKIQIHPPWKHALIIKMFDMCIGYLQMKRILRSKWAIRGDFF